MKLLKKLFCLHTWESLRKSKYKWNQDDIVEGTEFWFKPVIKEQHYSETIEWIVCKHCGKLKKIIY